LHQDVGKLGVPGSFEWRDGQLTVRGSGADIWGVADAFSFICQPWDGDIEMVVRVRDLEDTDPWAKAGLMVREDFSDGSKYAMVALTPQKGVTFLRRISLGGRTTDDSHQAMRMVPGARGAAYK
jgi:hypothetical protein